MIPRFQHLLSLCRMYDGSNASKRCPYNNHNWPSLFIGNPNLKGSPLHRDTFGSAFFSIQLRGSKRWRVYAASDAPLLYPSLESDVKFDIFDTFSPHSAQGFPLAQFARSVEAVVGKGDLFYVPAGSPHQVEMIETGEEVNVMLAVNYISAANLDLVIETTAPQVLEVKSSAAYSQRLYEPLHDFFAIHKTSLLRNVDWNIGHTRYRDFASRLLPQVCMSKLAFSVDGDAYFAEVNMLDPDVHRSAKKAAHIHSVPGIEDSLRAALVAGWLQQLRGRASKRPRTQRAAAPTSTGWILPCTCKAIGLSRGCRFSFAKRGSSPHIMGTISN